MRHPTYVDFRWVAQQSVFWLRPWGSGELRSDTALIRCEAAAHGEGVSQSAVFDRALGAPRMKIQPRLGDPSFGGPLDEPIGSKANIDDLGPDPLGGPPRATGDLGRLIPHTLQS